MEEQFNPYRSLSRWLNDGNKHSPIPEKLKNTKAFSQNIILYHFKFSKYIMLINDLFNNFELYKMSINDVLKELKFIQYNTHFKPPYKKRTKKINDKLVKALKVYYPYLKKNEVCLLSKYIESSDQKETILKTLGLQKDTEKKKFKKSERKEKEEEFKQLKQEQKNKMSVDDLLDTL